MKKYGIFYGSATGTTAKIADKIAKEIGVESCDIKDVKDSLPDEIGNYETVILGTSTWGDGEMEEDWYDFLAGADVLSLKDKKIALFGCGDETMSHTFCNGVGELYKRLQKTGATFIARFATDGYDFSESSAVIDGTGVGLLLDEVNKPELTDERVREWVELIKNS